MTSSCQSQSAEALSDPMPRIYSCFCQKLFTTYPGIYLHLKSKHANLFQKYKRLKITKLFKKVRDEKGSQIYKLDRLSEKEVTSTYSTQKLFKEQKKNSTLQNCEFKDQYPKDKFHQSEKKNHNSCYPHQTRKEPQNPYPFHQDYFKNFQAQMHNLRSYNSPFLNFNMPMSMPPFPHMLPNYPPPFPELKMTTKKLLQKFLLEIETVDKLMIKKYLYQLMVFIDKNSESIEDPRAKFKLFLSYCDEFDPKFIGPIIQHYVGQLKAQLKEPGINEDDCHLKQKEAECIMAFGNWLNQLGMTKFQQRRLAPQNYLAHIEKEKEPKEHQLDLLKVEKEIEEQEKEGIRKVVLDIRSKSEDEIQDDAF